MSWTEFAQMMAFVMLPFIMTAVFILLVHFVGKIK